MYWSLGIVCIPADVLKMALFSSGLISGPHSWEDCEVVCSSPKPVLVTTLGEGGQGGTAMLGWPPMPLRGSGRRDGAVSRPSCPDMLTRPLLSLLVCWPRVWEGSNERLATSSGSTPEMRHSVPLLGPPPYLGIQNFFGGMTYLILRSSLHYFSKFTAYSINCMLRVFQSCDF